MAETCTYRSERTLGSQEIVELDRRLQEERPGYKGFEPGSSQQASVDGLEALPDLPVLQGAKLGRTVVSGRLSDPPWEVFSKVLAAGRELVPGENVWARVGFEERESRQDSRAYDTVTASLKKGTPFFEYGANGSRVAKDPTYAQTVLSSMIEVLGLPLEMTVEGGEYFLKHARGGTLYLPRSGSKKQNPSAFQCEMEGADAQTLVDLMQRLLDRFASEKRLDQSWQVWTASNAPWDPIPEAEGLYRAVREAGFPADSYRLDLTLFLENLEGLDVWKGLVSGDLYIATELGAIELSKTNWLKTGVVTTSEGHRVEVETRLEMDQSEIEDIVGLKLEKTVN